MSIVTNDMKNKVQFTMEQSLAIQEAHLKQWETILKPEVAAKLRSIVIAKNKGVTDPYDVCRGSSIDNFVHNPAQYLDFH